MVDISHLLKFTNLRWVCIHQWTCWSLAIVMPCWQQPSRPYIHKHFLQSRKRLKFERSAWNLGKYGRV